MSTMPYPSPQQVFQMQYQSVRRDEVVGVLLAFFLGCFGVHHFYLGRVGLGDCVYPVQLDGDTGDIGRD